MKLEFTNSRTGFRLVCLSLTSDNDSWTATSYKPGKTPVTHNRIIGSVNEATEMMKLKGYDRLMIDDKDVIALVTIYTDIPGYHSIYKFNGQDVLSYHSGNPYRLKPVMKYDSQTSTYGTDLGYNLSLEGNKKFFSIEKLRELCSNIVNNVKEKVMSTALVKNTFIVGSTNGNGSISFSEYPRVHVTEAVARAEAARLAKLNPGKHFVVAQIKGIAVTNDITWS